MCLKARGELITRKREWVEWKTNERWMVVVDESLDCEMAEISMDDVRNYEINDQKI